MRSAVPRRQDVEQLGKTLAQGLDLGDRQRRLLRIIRADADRQVGRLGVDFLEQVADQGFGVLRVKRVLPFQDAQQLLPYVVVVRMALRAQAPAPSINFASQSSSRRPEVSATPLERY